MFDLISSVLDIVEVESESDFEFVNMVEENDEKTIKELDAPNKHYQPLCIQYRALDATFELKYRLIHLLPKFHGLAREDPNKHLKEFQVVCSTMKHKECLRSTLS